MNELGLPPHGHEPSFAADETAYGAAVHTATRRRRTRAVAGTSTTAALALVAFAALSGPGGGTASLEPANDPVPTATRPASAAPSAVAAPAYGDGALPPPPLPTLPPLPTASPSPKPSPAPKLTSTATPSPGATPAPEWHESWQYVAEDPTKTCHRLDAPNWCLRYAGPMSARSGEPVAFVNEMCRMSTARTASRIDLRYAHDLVVVVGKAGNYPGDTWAMSVSGEVEERPHSIPVSPGQCVRWTSAWNGVATNAPALEPGTYTLAVFLQGETPGEQPAGSQEPKRGWAFQVEGFEVSA